MEIEIAPMDRSHALPPAGADRLSTEERHDRHPGQGDRGNSITQGDTMNTRNELLKDLSEKIDDLRSKIAEET